MSVIDNEILDSGIEEYFEIGQKISIVRTFAEETQSHPSYVKDLTEECLFIDTAISGGTTLPLYEDSLIEVTITRKDGIWSGESFVVAVEGGKIPGAWITYPEYLSKVQRREYMRWDLKFPVIVSILSPGGVSEEIIAECNNVSSMGLGVISKNAFPKHSEMRIKFDYCDISVDSRVDFIHNYYDNLNKKYVTGFEFLEVDHKIADKIHKLGVLNQLELKRKGLL